MKNSIVNSQKDFLFNETLRVSDYSSIKKNELILYTITLDASFFSTAVVSDDDKWERISYTLYGSSEFWDLLSVLNGRDAFFGLPFNFDTLSAIVDDKITSFNNNMFYGNLSQKTINVLNKTWMNEEYVKNEKNRKIIVITPAKLSEYMMGLRTVLASNV